MLNGLVLLTPGPPRITLPVGDPPRGLRYMHELAESTTEGFLSPVAVPPVSVALTSTLPTGRHGYGRRSGGQYN